MTPVLKMRPPIAPVALDGAGEIEALSLERAAAELLAETRWLDLQSKRRASLIAEARRAAVDVAAARARLKRLRRRLGAT